MFPFTRSSQWPPDGPTGLMVAQQAQGNLGVLSVLIRKGVLREGSRSPEKLPSVQVKQKSD